MHEGEKTYLTGNTDTSLPLSPVRSADPLPYCYPSNPFGQPHCKYFFKLPKKKSTVQTEEISKATTNDMAYVHGMDPKNRAARQRNIHQLKFSAYLNERDQFGRLLAPVSPKMAMATTEGVEKSTQEFGIKHSKSLDYRTTVPSPFKINMSFTENGADEQVQDAGCAETPVSGVKSKILRSLLKNSLPKIGSSNNLSPKKENSAAKVSWEKSKFKLNKDPLSQVKEMFEVVHKLRHNDEDIEKCLQRLCMKKEAKKGFNDQANQERFKITVKEEDRPPSATRYEPKFSLIDKNPHACIFKRAVVRDPIMEQILLRRSKSNSSLPIIDYLPPVISEKPVDRNAIRGPKFEGYTPHKLILSNSPNYTKKRKPRKPKQGLPTNPENSKESDSEDDTERILKPKVNPKEKCFKTLSRRTNLLQLAQPY